MLIVAGHHYVGVDFTRGICGVSIIRSGEAMETALRECCQGVKVGKILVHRCGQRMILGERFAGLKRRNECTLSHEQHYQGISVSSAVLPCAVGVVGVWGSQSLPVLLTLSASCQLSENGATFIPLS